MLLTSYLRGRRKGKVHKFVHACINLLSARDLGQRASVYTVCNQAFPTLPFTGRPGDKARMLHIHAHNQVANIYNYPDNNYYNNINLRLCLLINLHLFRKFLGLKIIIAS